MYVRQHFLQQFYNTILYVCVCVCVCVCVYIYICTYFVIFHEKLYNLQ